MARNNRKKTDIPVPEPRHRVGPKGVSSGISFRDLPPPSLDEIKKICEHYQMKSAGTYKSLASRYVYQMGTEIEQLVDALKEGGCSEGSLSTMDDHDLNAPAGEPRDTRSEKRPSVNSRTRRSSDKRNASSSSGNHLHGSRPCTAPATRKSSHASYRKSTREFPPDYADGVSVDSPPTKPRHCGSRRQRRDVDSLSNLNLEDQNEDLLRWLREEMKRSQSLITRSKHLHDAELVSAKKEVEKASLACNVQAKTDHHTDA